MRRGVVLLGILLLSLSLVPGLAFATGESEPACPIYGEYVTEGAILTWDDNGWCYTFWVDPDLVYYTSESTLEGYDFYEYFSPEDQ